MCAGNFTVSIKVPPPSKGCSSQTLPYIHPGQAKWTLVQRWLRGCVTKVSLAQEGHAPAVAFLKFSMCFHLFCMDHTDDGPGLSSIEWEWELGAPSASDVQTREGRPLPGGKEATPGVNTQEKAPLVPFLEVPPGLMKNPGAQCSEGRFPGNFFFPSSLQKYKTQTMLFL